MPSLWPAIGVVGLYFALALFGVFTIVPWSVQSLLLAAAITATGLSLENGFRDFRWPDWRDAARRLEKDNRLLHRPLSEADDRIMAGRGDPVALELWAHHRVRALPEHLGVSWPDPDFDSRDPKKLHLILLALLAASLIAARGDWRTRLISAFDSGAAAGISLDAWVDPPPYTGVAPIYLPPGARHVIAVPIGSVLNLRAHGASHPPGIMIGNMNPPHFTGESGEYALVAKITHDGRVRVRASGHRIGNWNLQVIPDHIPVVAFTAKPSVTKRDAVKFAYKASDDYAVASVKVVIRPHGKPGAPLVVDLPLAPAKKVAQTSYSDLTGHPYAGLMVDAYLQARDGAGQVGKSKTVTFRLPARVFTDPLARALVEQRQALATSADAKDRKSVADMLNALTLAPDKFYADQMGAYTAIRSAYWALRTARTKGDLNYVEDLLWQTAMALEQKGLLTAANSLRKLQAMITAALAAHAPQPVIDQLLQRYNQAMQRYLQAMLENSRNGNAKNAPPNPNAKMLGTNDLQKMMKAIQQLAASGNREAAAQMLAALQNILENMRIARQPGSGQGSQRNKALNKAIQEYGEMMGQQRALIDKTMRQQQGSSNPKDGGPQGLARQQNELHRRLNRAMGKMGTQMGRDMGKAGEAMGQAEKSLNGRDLANARNAQEQALSALRRGAEALAKQMQNSPGGPGNGQVDPLGRGLIGVGNNIKLPNASDLERARHILRELRRRAGERNRPPQELQYYDRLLKEF